MRGRRLVLTTLGSLSGFALVLLRRPGAIDRVPTRQGTFIEAILRSIYAQIAFVVPCDPSQYWSRRP